MPCDAADEGNCDREADCVHLGPGAHQCVCKSGESRLTAAIPVEKNPY